MYDLTFINKAPTAGWETYSPLACPAGERLCEVLGVEYLTDVARVINLLGFTPQDSYPLRAAAIAARYVQLTEYNIFLGREVAAAFGVQPVRYLFWYSLKGKLAAVLPHPTKKNPWWKDVDNVNSALLFLEEIIPHEALVAGRRSQKVG